MKGPSKVVARLLASGIIAMPGVAFAQADRQGASSDEAADANVIVVTAQKREQGINSVPLSISAISGDQLAEQGIKRTEDLALVVPGLSFAETQFDAPVFTLRGVGYNENSLAASPTVSVYVDEVPLPYPAMTRGGTLDLARVEVLKGPQGTLFGQNSTGGAINYVAARPTGHFAAGTDARYSSLGTFDGSAFVSGPIAEGLKARAAVSWTKGGAWQRSTTRDDRLGSQDLMTGRLLLDWDPSPDFSVKFNINGWRDNSDSQAAQLVGLFSANGGPLPPAFTGAPIILSPRAADWTTGIGLKRDNEFHQLSMRADWGIADSVDLTSITAFQKFNRNSLQDADGLTAIDLHLGLYGSIRSFTQELRLSGTSGPVTWILGGNYQKDKVHDLQSVFLEDSPASFVGPFQFKGIVNDAFNRIETYAVFGNLEYELTDALTVQGGLRYTRSKIDYRACTKDSGAGDGAQVIGFVQMLAGVPVTTAPGQCVTLLPDFSTGNTINSLDEDNVSWRVSVDYELARNALVYASVSSGYKAGSFPTLSAQASTQLSPVTQEHLTAYEAGFKLPLANRMLQLNGAVFYYNYRDKQLSGRIQVPLFGQLQKLVNIPRSDVKGAELQVNLTPTAGLHLSGALTYLDTRIRLNDDGSSFENFDQFGNLVALSGNRFPYSPKWQGNLDVGYEWNLSDSLRGSIGASLNYKSETKSGLEDDARLNIDAYALVDLRAGIAAADDSWSISLFGRNVFNTYYWNNVLHIQDTIVRYTGKPAEYGVGFSTKF